MITQSQISTILSLLNSPDLGDLEGLLEIPELDSAISARYPIGEAQAKLLKELGGNATAGLLAYEAALNGRWCAFVRAAFLHGLLRPDLHTLVFDDVAKRQVGQNELSAESKLLALLHGRSTAEKKAARAVIVKTLAVIDQAKSEFTSPVGKRKVRRNSSVKR